MKKFLASQFLKRLCLFLFLFLLQSGIIGPWVIGTHLLYPFYFFIYGNLGKLVLFGAIAFLFYVKERILTVHVGKYNKKNLFFILAGFLTIPLFFVIANQLLTYQLFFSNIPLSLATHAILILGSIFFLLGVFGISFIKKFILTFKKELIVSVILAVVYDFLIFYVWNFWTDVSWIVLQIEAFLFSFTFPVHIFPPLSLFVKTFTVEIDAPCSGLDSLLLFTSLYILIGLFDYRILNMVKYILMFIPTLIGLFIVNIIRVYSLIWVGIIFTPHLTLELFHTYIGMVLFIIYFLIFMRVSYRWFRIK